MNPKREEEYRRAMQNQTTAIATRREGVVPQKIGELNKELSDLRQHWSELKERLSNVTRSLPEKNGLGEVPMPPQVVPLAEQLEDALRCIRYISVELNDVIANLEV